MSAAKRLLSFILPITEWQGRGKHGPITLQWDAGRLVVNSSHANQSKGSSHRVWHHCLVELNVKQRNPANVLILGFGAGDAAFIMRHELRIAAPITGVDDDPQMLRIARQYFNVGAMADLELVEADAIGHVTRDQARYDLVVVDLWNDNRLAPGIDTEEFIRHLAERTNKGGLLFFNTMDHDPVGKAESQRVGAILRRYFNDCQALHLMGANHVFVASQPNHR